MADRSAEPTEAKLGQKRLLLVEDHADTAAGLAWLLGRAGYHVRSVATAAQALAAAASEPFDVVVSDLGLPDGNGFELMTELRQRHGLAGIALTGFDSAEELELGRKAGFSAHLVKPVNWDELRGAIAAVLARGAAPPSGDQGGVPRITS